jgi:serine/threonine-protein kinase HipA
MDVCGEGRDITRAHLLELARQGGVPLARASQCIERLQAQAVAFRTTAKDRGIRPATLKRVAAAVEANRERLAA